MTELIWDAGFKRSYKKRISKNFILKKKFWESIEKFEKNPFLPILKTHKLTGKLSGCLAFSFHFEYRVVFRFINNDKSVLLIDIGTHDEVY